MAIRPEVVPFVASACLAGVVIALLCVSLGTGWPRGAGVGLLLAVILVGYFLYFFRDPARQPPIDPTAVLAGADGHIANIVEVREDEFLKTDTVRISIFLSLFDVHVNRAPVSGKATFLGYFPGKHVFTFKEKSSEYNQHNAILIQGPQTRCLVKQIVGPVCRRVVYWLDHGGEADVSAGDRIGMMKFGSRLDMYFPKGDVSVVTRVGDRVRAGETVIATVGKGDDS